MRVHYIQIQYSYYLKILANVYGVFTKTLTLIQAFIYPGMLYISDLSKSYLYFVYERHNTACLHKMVHSLFLVFNLKKETQKT